MLALATEKAQSPKGALSSLLALQPGFKANDKFSSLLKSFSLEKLDTKDFLFAQVDAKGLKLEAQETKLDVALSDLPLEETPTTDSKKLISLLALGNESKGDEEQLNPNIIKALPTEGIKQNIQALIGEAKTYLKDQILQKIDIKELPKTLGGLIKLAQKSGIDIKGINFDSLSKVDFSKDLTQALTMKKSPISPVLLTNDIVKPSLITTDKEPVQKPLNALLSKGTETLIPSEKEIKILEPKIKDTLKPSEVITKNVIAQAKDTPKPIVPTSNVTTSKLQEVPVPLQQTISPLVVKTKEVTENTQKINTKVQGKLLTKVNDIATPSIPVVDVLEDEVSKPTKTLPSAITALLHGDETNKDSESGARLELGKESDKPQSITQVKTEALTQKITEAKQLITHVAQNVRESIENYKPPFTRIKMQLNPQKFGDMEVTLIQRGSNVHININASSSALTVMMQNAHELKAQLSSQGLGDASMNFSSHQQDQQEQKQKQEHAGMTYEEYQDYEEELTEVATALEIVVPRYI
ncbi:flagellar hook-length control protein FliK [Sulfurimonas sp. MAG313]|nr:flagellar hook-length control protein FliK [Sulfurimonas sp. MAG313]MDF1880951.1 flagellar hook-length control protein FliK [Sulfurimonas sp. MAG313]